jgi:hypothetical protein
MNQLYKRDHSPDHHAEEQTKREHADESRYRHDKLRTIASPELLHGWKFEQPRHASRWCKGIWEFGLSW